MKRQFLLMRLLLLFALIVGSGSNVWADEVVHYTLDGTTTGGTNGYAEESNITQNGMSWEVTGNTTTSPWRFGGKSISNTDRPMYSTTAMGSAITKIQVSTGAASSITVNSVKLIVASDAAFSSKIDEVSKTFAANSTITFTPTSPATDWATGAYYKIVFNVTVSGSSNKYVEFKNAKFYKEKIDITSISLPPAESVGVGGTVTLTPTVTPANYNEAIDWESDDTDVATVSSAGVVTGKAAGTAHIKAKAHDHPSTIYSECTVTVTAPIAVTGVSLNKTSLDMYFGDTETLSPIIVPANATNKAVSWESDDTKVATVSSDGLVTAVGPGTCTITVTTDDGDYTATCDVTVTIASIDLSVPKVISDWDVVSGSGYYSSDTYLMIEGYTFKLYKCMKQSSILQLQASNGVFTSPTINSANGFTLIIETGSDSNDAGVLTVQIGSETAQTVTGKNKTLIVKTDATSKSFTIKNLSSKVMQVSKITIIPNSAEVQSYGWATYIAPAAVAFAANTAYVVTNVDSSSGAVTVKTVSSVPSNTPVLLKGAGSKTITVLAEAPTAPATNLLEVYDGGDKGEQVPYVLAKNGDGAGFKKWTGSASTITGRVVLWLDSEISAAATREFLPFNEDETTGINTIENTNTEVKNNVYYNLSGQRVMNPSKGLYIVNGKKVIIK